MSVEKLPGSRWGVDTKSCYMKLPGKAKLQKHTRKLSPTYHFLWFVPAIEANVSLKEERHICNPQCMNMQKFPFSIFKKKKKN